MNVAIFTDNDFVKVNGVTTTLRAVVQYAPDDVRVRVYTAAGEGSDRSDYFALRSLGLPIPWYGEMRMYVPRLRAYLAEAVRDRIDVVHLTTPGPVGLAALYVASRLRLPLVGSFHTDLAAYTTLLSGSSRLGALMQEYLRWLYNRCARVLAPSEATRAMLIAARCRPERLAVWPRGVDTELFSPAKRSRRLRDSWHVSDRRPAIVYVGRVSAEKGLRMLPSLQQTLHAAGLQHRFIIVGQGPMRGELERHLWDAVFTGALPRTEVAEVFASSDLFVFPSRTDTAGNVVLEAQASGLPVLVSGAGGPRENMEDGRTGYVCDDETGGEWAERAVRLLRNEPLRRGMRERARDYALSRRWDCALKSLYDAYRSVVTAPRTNDAGSLLTRAVPRIP